MSNAVQFILDGKTVTLSDYDPTRTVLQYLREDQRRLGTKEGCAEGDCGACTVVLAERQGDSGEVRYRAVNSCILFVPALHGKELITVESLKTKDGQLHPVQQAMVDTHASQCGFCTPGFVMSLYALYQSTSSVDRKTIDTALAGNLCRCTGYRPILDAAESVFKDREKNFDTKGLTSSKALQDLRQDESLTMHWRDKRYFAPRSVNELAILLEEYPAACIVAGGTDVGLWVTKQHLELDTVIYIGEVQELLNVSETDEAIEIGAAVTLTDSLEVLDRHYPDLQELWLRFASPPIRNSGTLGGNIANGSPIGDSMPVLIAIGASLVLRKGSTEREIALENFYLDYMKNDLLPGEFVERIKIPYPAKGQVVRTYKLSKRYDQDISAVCAAFALQLDDNIVKNINIAYGGMAAIPKRAVECVKALSGENWTEESIQQALGALRSDFNPIDDMRASADYRQTVAGNLLQRFFLETSGQDVKTDVYHFSV